VVRVSAVWLRAGGSRVRQFRVGFLGKYFVFSGLGGGEVRLCNGTFPGFLVDFASGFGLK